MARRITEIRVGIAVLLAIIVLVTGVTWLSEFRVAQKRVQYVVLFSDVGGLQEGDPVTISGVKTGRVGAIHLIRSGVAVDLSIDRSVVIPIGSRVNVRNTGIIGEKFIAIDIVEADNNYAAGDTILGTYESGVPEVISQMGDALRALERVSDQVDRILSVAEEEGRLRRTMENVEQASLDVSATVAENRADLRTTTVNLKEMSELIKSLVEEKGPVMEGTVDQLALTTTRVDTLVTNLDRLAGEVEVLTQRLQSDQTTLGKIMADRELYDEFRFTIRELNLLIQDVKRNPRKYFKFSVF
jgi:phospholipid/cholesterol/gamma-HCH transport system substrate-binding protein